MDEILSDPTTFSQLPPKIENLRFIEEITEHGYRGVDKYEDIESGQIYYEVPIESRTQALVSHLLKGILPVSDIVKVWDEDKKTNRFFQNQ